MIPGSRSPETLPLRALRRLSLQPKQKRRAGRRPETRRFGWSMLRVESFGNLNAIREAGNAEAGAI